ncbi:type II toxin-antitoxin system ParD family antitoxin [Magnetospira sp. QH-2]|uniref:ribbon-helix-helix domain-containing protein n=1 Tax=Magnetospira sp. (strain QH-2) TaxID=1288970 RepID=UPI0003E80FD3|nr:type II toxin-antitoxin system ParD family antitoxin [Magnetospira sp. QH-2]CCQ72459.1 conserved protein of unknown function [Magnetospira sp. QH-2]
MTAKPTVSLTDHGYQFAKSLVESGKFASISAVMQHGLRLVEREEEAHRVRLEAIRDDLEVRATEPVLTEDEMNGQLEAMLADKRRAWLGDGT